MVPIPSDFLESRESPSAGVSGCEQGAGMTAAFKPDRLILGDIREDSLLTYDVSVPQMSL